MMNQHQNSSIFSSSANIDHSSATDTTNPTKTTNTIATLSESTLYGSQLANPTASTQNRSENINQLSLDFNRKPSHPKQLFVVSERSDEGNTLGKTNTNQKSAGFSRSSENVDITEFELQGVGELPNFITKASSNAFSQLGEFKPSELAFEPKKSNFGQNGQETPQRGSLALRDSHGLEIATYTLNLKAGQQLSFKKVRKDDFRGSGSRRGKFGRNLDSEGFGPNLSDRKLDEIFQGRDGVVITTESDTSDEIQELAKERGLEVVETTADQLPLEVLEILRQRQQGVRFGHLEGNQNQEKGENDEKIGFGRDLGYEEKNESMVSSKDVDSSYQLIVRSNDPKEFNLMSFGGLLGNQHSEENLRSRRQTGSKRESQSLHEAPFMPRGIKNHVNQAKNVNSEREPFGPISESKKLAHRILNSGNSSRASVRTLEKVMESNTKPISTISPENQNLKIKPNIAIALTLDQQTGTIHDPEPPNQPLNTNLGPMITQKNSENPLEKNRLQELETEYQKKRQQIEQEMRQFEEANNRRKEELFQKFLLERCSVEERSRDNHTPITIPEVTQTTPKSRQQACSHRMLSTADPSIQGLETDLSSSYNQQKVVKEEIGGIVTPLAPARGQNVEYLSGITLNEGEFRGDVGPKEAGKSGLRAASFGVGVDGGVGSARKEPSVLDSDDSSSAEDLYYNPIQNDLGVDEGFRPGGEMAEEHKYALEEPSESENRPKPLSEGQNDLEGGNPEEGDLGPSAQLESREVESLVVSQVEISSHGNNLDCGVRDHQYVQRPPGTERNREILPEMGSVGGPEGSEDRVGFGGVGRKLRAEMLVEREQVDQEDHHMAHHNNQNGYTGQDGLNWAFEGLRRSVSEYQDFGSENHKNLYEHPSEASQEDQKRPEIIDPSLRGKLENHEFFGTVFPKRSQKGFTPSQEDFERSDIMIKIRQTFKNIDFSKNQKKLKNRENQLKRKENCYHGSEEWPESVNNPSKNNLNPSKPFSIEDSEINKLGASRAHQDPCNDSEIEGARQISHLLSGLGLASTATAQDLLFQSQQQEALVENNEGLKGPHYDPRYGQEASNNLFDCERGTFGQLTPEMSPMTQQSAEGVESVESARKEFISLHKQPSESRKNGFSAKRHNFVKEPFQAKEISHNDFKEPRRDLNLDLMDSRQSVTSLAPERSTESHVQSTNQNVDFSRFESTEDGLEGSLSSLVNSSVNKGDPGQYGNLGDEWLHSGVMDESSCQETLVRGRNQPDEALGHTTQNFGPKIVSEIKEHTNEAKTVARSSSSLSNNQRQPEIRHYGPKSEYQDSRKNWDRSKNGGGRDGSGVSLGLEDINICRLVIKTKPFRPNHLYTRPMKEDQKSQNQHDFWAYFDAIEHLRSTQRLSCPPISSKKSSLPHSSSANQRSWCIKKECFLYSFFPNQLNRSKIALGIKAIFKIGDTNIKSILAKIFDRTAKIQAYIDSRADILKQCAFSDKNLTLMEELISKDRAWKTEQKLKALALSGLNNDDQSVNGSFILFNNPNEKRRNLHQILLQRRLKKLREQQRLNTLQSVTESDGRSILAMDLKYQIFEWHEQSLEGSSQFLDSKFGNGSPESVESSRMLLGGRQEGEKTPKSRKNQIFLKHETASKFRSCSGSVVKFVKESHGVAQFKQIKGFSQHFDEKKLFKKKKFVRLFQETVMKIPVELEIRATVKEIWELITSKKLPEAKWLEMVNAFITQRARSRGLGYRGRRRSGSRSRSKKRARKSQSRWKLAPKRRPQKGAQIGFGGVGGASQSTGDLLGADLRGKLSLRRLKSSQTQKSHFGVIEERSSHLEKSPVSQYNKGPSIAKQTNSGRYGRPKPSEIEQYNPYRNHAKSSVETTRSATNRSSRQFMGSLRGLGLGEDGSGSFSGKESISSALGFLSFERKEAHTGVSINSSIGHSSIGGDENSLVGTDQMTWEAGHQKGPEHDLADYGKVELKEMKFF